MREKKRGFTIIELIVVLGIISLLCTLAFRFSFTGIRENEVSGAVQGFVFAARQAQIVSRAGEGNAPCGVYAQTGGITVFQGESYATRDASLHRIFSVADSVSFVGDTEIVFDHFTGKPDAGGVLVISSPGGPSVSVTINAEGMVGY